MECFRLRLTSFDIIHIYCILNLFETYVLARFLFSPDKSESTVLSCRYLRSFHSLTEKLYRNGSFSLVFMCLSHHMNGTPTDQL